MARGEIAHPQDRERIVGQRDRGRTCFLERPRAGDELVHGESLRRVELDDGDLLLLDHLEDGNFSGRRRHAFRGWRGHLDARAR